MSDTKPGDLPAFPADLPHVSTTARLHYFGLTKREYFAASALQGLLAGDTEDRRSESNIAVIAVSCADALLAALEGNHE